MKYENLLMADLEKQLRAPTKASYFGNGEGISLVQLVAMTNTPMLLLMVGMIFAMLSLCHYILSTGNCSNSLLVVPIYDAICAVWSMLTWCKCCTLSGH